MTESDLLELLGEMFGSEPWPDAVRYLHGIALARSGIPIHDAAKRVGTLARHLRPLLEPRGGAWQALGTSPDKLEPAVLRRARSALGQMLLGRAAEQVFTDLYKEAVETEELVLVNLSAAGTDTDYRVVNGRGRAVFRINIKFHGAQFRRAVEMVGIAPEDCFALATYKIRNAVQKQDVEGMPYFFAIVGVPGMTGEVIGDMFADNVATAMALILASPRVGAKRNFEDRVIDYSVGRRLPLYMDTYDRVRAAAWYMLSARRAEVLLKEKLWERVYALRVRNFARTFGRAEVDMHFSLSEDLTPLSEFFAALREGGPPRAAALLERGHL